MHPLAAKAAVRLRFHNLSVHSHTKVLELSQPLNSRPEEQGDKSEEIAASFHVDCHWLFELAGTRTRTDRGRTKSL